MGRRLVGEFSVIAPERNFLILQTVLEVLSRSPTMVRRWFRKDSVRVKSFSQCIFDFNLTLDLPLYHLKYIGISYRTIDTP